MNSLRRASASIVAAAIFAILCGAVGALVTFAALLVSARSGFPPGATYPDFIRPFVFGIWIFFFLCALFVVVVGIQILRLRNWARISLLVVAGCLLFFGIIGIAIILLTRFVVALADPLVPNGLLAFVLSVIYGIPAAVSLWWLILFTRRSVVAQFQAAAELEAPALSATAHPFNNPQCPLAIRIIGWYLASFVFFLPFLPFLLGRVPAFFLGHVFRGPAALLLFTLNLALLFVPGFGLLLLKRWSYPLTIASQLFVCVNGISATFSPAFVAMLRTVLTPMNLPGISPSSQQILNYSRYFNLLSLVLPAAILITLFVVRRQFLAAARPPVLRAGE